MTLAFSMRFSETGRLSTDCLKTAISSSLYAERSYEALNVLYRSI